MRRLAAVLPLVGAALLLSACGGSNAAGAGGAAEAAANGGSTDFTAYRQCLSEHGVDLPEGGGLGGGRPSDRPTDFPSGAPTDFPSGRPTDVPSGAPGSGRGGGFGGGMRLPDGVDEATWQAARKACSSLAPARPQGGQGMPGGTGGQAGSGSPNSAATSSAGKNTVFWQCMADHDVTAPASGDPDDLDSSDDTVAAALKTCRALLP